MSLTEAVDNGRLESAFEGLRETVRIEGKRTTAERQAFEAFGRRIRRIARTVDRSNQRSVEGEGVVNVTSSMNPFQTDSTITSNTRASIQTAYEETVMSVAHYESEYNDSYETSVHAEFGQEIAAALTLPGQFSAVTLQALVGNVETAIEERKQFEAAVDRELESLETTSVRLQDIEAERQRIAGSGLEGEQFGTLDAYRTRVHLLSEKCDGIVETRQSTIRDHRDTYSIQDDPDSFVEYMYDSYDARYPVLFLCSDVSRGLESTYDRIVQTIIRNW